MSNGAEAQPVALVVGGSSGIGLAIAEMLTAEGFRVVLAARRPDGLARAVDRLKPVNADTRAILADVGQADTLRSMFEQISDSYGRLDVLVNSAGVAVRADLASVQLSHIGLQLRINLEGVIVTCRLAFDLLRRTASAHGLAQVINVGSYVGAHPTATLATYSAAKAGARAFSEALNREWGRLGIRSTVLSPGYVATAMAAEDPANRNEQPLLEPEDIADAARFLVRMSPRCVVPEMQLLRPGFVA